MAPVGWRNGQPHETPLRAAPLDKEVTVEQRYNRVNIFCLVFDHKVDIVSRAGNPPVVARHGADQHVFDAGIRQSATAILEQLVLVIAESNCNFRADRA